MHPDLRDSFTIILVSSEKAETLGEYESIQMM